MRCEARDALATEANANANGEAVYPTAELTYPTYPYLPDLPTSPTYPSYLPAYLPTLPTLSYPI